MMNRYTSILFFACTLSATAQLSGTYTVGGNGANYATPAAAFAALNAQGANGDVTFLINPGTYNGQYSLGTIPGSPGNIHVRSVMNDAATVTLEFDAAFPLPNHIIELNGTPNVKFEDITFHALNNDRARIIHFTGDADYLKLWDCVFIGSQSTSTNSYFDRVLVHCDQNNINTPNNPDYLQVLNCDFRYGYQGIELDAEGNSGARAQGIMIAENRFEDQLSLGITVNNATGEIAKNFITTSGGNSYTGIRTSYFDNGSKIHRNTIQAHATLFGCTGIEAGNTQNTTGNQIHNNMVTVSASSAEVWGIGVYNLWDMSIIWNSVVVTGGGASSKAFYHLSNFADAQDCVIRNNIFVNYADGPALQTTVPGNIATEDHNCLWSSGSVLVNSGGTEYATLAAYQGASGDGAADLELDPAFPNLPDLHVNSCELDGLGEWFPIGLGDIDYEARGNPICDIGADEFTFSSTYSTGTITVAVDDLPFALSAPAGTNYSWSQGANTQSINVVTAGVYTCTFIDVNGCSYTLSWTLSVDFSTGVHSAEVNVPVLFPVPATDVLQVAGIDPGKAFTILDAQGRCVLNGITTGNTTIAVESLATGMHLFRWDGGGTLRFLKH